MLRELPEGLLSESTPSNETFSKIFPLFDRTKLACYTSIAGITNAIYAQYTPANQVVYQQIYRILEHFGLTAYLFAGSLVGYVRNKQMPPWLDDVDFLLFSEQVERFEQRVVPYLKAAGFNTFAPIDYPGGGHHILTLQTTQMRESTIPFDEGLDVVVPWAQADVFYSFVTEAGIVQNPASWGLYHDKKIPVEWVRPGTTVHFNNWEVRVFGQFEQDIQHEYGDVQNNVVIGSHGQTFLEAYKTPWSAIDEALQHYRATAVSELPPSISAAAIAGYRPNEGVRLTPAPKDSFARIMSKILASGAQSVELVDPDHFFWALDLKRLLPGLELTAVATDERTAARANHLHFAIDRIEGHDESARAIVQDQRRHLDLAVPADA